VKRNGTTNSLLTRWQDNFKGKSISVEWKSGLHSEAQGGGDF